MDLKQLERQLLEKEASLFKDIMRRHRWAFLKVTAMYIGSLFASTMALGSFVMPVSLLGGALLILINFIVHRKFLLPVLAQPIVEQVEKEYKQEFAKIIELEKELLNELESQQKDRNSN